MSQSISLARARITAADGKVRYDRAQCTVRRGTMHVSAAGMRAVEPGVTSVELVREGTWSVGFDSGETLTVERIARKCGSCGGRR